MLKVSPLAVIVFAVLTFAGLSYGAGPGGRSPGGRGPGGAGAAGAGGAGARTFSGGANVGNAGASFGGGARPNLNQAGQLPGNFNGGNLRGTPGISSGALQGSGRISSEQLNGFIGNQPRDAQQRGAYTDVRSQTTQNNVDQRRQTEVVQNNMNVHKNTFNQNVFSPQWYNDHPNAWQGQYPHADAYAAATWGNTSRWLGVTAAPVPYDYGTVVYQTNNYSTTDSAQQAETSSNLADKGSESTTTDASDWMSLGAFGLVPANHTSATGMVQLSVSKEGALNGSYIDMLSQASSPVSGAVDKQTQLAAWKISGNDGVVFETAISSLTSDSAPLTVRVGPQQAQQWQLVRAKQ